MRNPASLHNPHARPRSKPPRPIPVWPPVVDCTDQADTVPALVFGGDEYSWDNPAVWRMEYRCRYESGRLDERLHLFGVISATRAHALEKLQRRLLGFRVATILLYHIRPPPARETIEAIRAANEEVDQLRKAKEYSRRDAENAEKNMNPEINQPQSEIEKAPAASGTDLDVWGGADTRASTLPRPGEPNGCVLADTAGNCPAGCAKCLEFERENPPATPDPQV